MASTHPHNTLNSATGRPQLDLSGPRLKTALETMIHSCESTGGVERYVDAMKLKSKIFQDNFNSEKISALSADDFTRIASLMPTVRRRIGVYLEDDTYPHLQKMVGGLFNDDEADVKLASFCAAFPDDKHHRWVRDLGAEILHQTNPEIYPLMNRWVWDRKANSGVIREIWYCDIDHITLDIDDRYDTYLMLREELSQFLSDNGIFQDVMTYIDLLCASIYADYVAAQGGSYLKADFSAAEDPAKHMRRLLGLDGVKTKSNRKLPASIDGNAQLVRQSNWLTGEKA